MPQQDDQYSSGPAPAPPYRRASAKHPALQGQGQGPQRVATPLVRSYDSQPGSQGALALEDVLWYGACGLLSLACLGTLGYWLYRIVNGQVDGTRMAILVLIVLIYALCVACGWWWARAQSIPVQETLRQRAESWQRHAEGLQQQVEGLQQNLEYLTRETQNLQQKLREKRVLGPGDSGIAAKNSPGGPQKMAPLPPPGSIYDEQREPADPSDLGAHPHEKRFPAPGELNVLEHGWRLIAASRRGYGHGYEGKYREDDFQVKILNNQAVGPALAVVALADGVSSKGLSRKGALASVEGATALSEQQVARLKTMLYHNGSPEDLRAAATTILMDSLRGAAEAVKRVSLNERIPLDDLHATLLVFLAAALGSDELFLARVQIGDGAMFGVRANGGKAPNVRWRQLLAPQIQAAGNEVQPFMRSQERDWQQHMQFDILTSIAGVMAMTDGIADDIEPPPPTPGELDPDHFSMVDRFHQTYVLPTLQAPQPADELVRYIGYRRAQSIDDRTLVYLYHK